MDPNQNYNYQNQNQNYNYQNQDGNYQGQQNYHYNNNPYADPNYRRENPGNGFFSNNDYNMYEQVGYQGGYSNVDTQAAVQNVMTKTFLYMVIALSLSLIAAVLTVHAITNGALTLDGYMGLMIGSIVVELVFVFVGNAALSKGNAGLGGVSFIIYSIANGITLSTVFLTYQIGSVVSVFLTCAIVFATMAVIGFITKKDLTGIGNLALMILIGVIVASLVNFALKSVMIDYAISYIGVALFAGLTAYDTQKIKNIAASGADANVIGLWGALELYLDFINLFLYLIRIFGKRR